MLGLISLFIFYNFIESDLKTNLYFPFFKFSDKFRMVYSILFVCNSWILKCSKFNRWFRWFSNCPVILVASCFAFISYVSGNIIFSKYLLILILKGLEKFRFCGAIIGASIGFLWFNAPPAKIFMGDTGSLALGGSLGAVGVVTKHEIVLAITGAFLF